MTAFSYATIAAPSGVELLAYEINNSGQVVGSYTDTRTHGFIYSGGSFTVLDDPLSVEGIHTIPGTVAYDINDSGQVVGLYAAGLGLHSFFYSGGGYTTIEPEESLGASSNIYVNNSGQIAGNYKNESFPEDEGAFLYSGGVFTEITTPNFSIPYMAGFNDAGQILFSAKIAATSLGYLYTNGSFVEIKHPSGKSTGAADLNNSGQVVGTYTDSGGQYHGYLFSGGTFTPIDPRDSIYTVVTDINDAGQIVGYYADTNHKWHGFLYSAGRYTRLDDPQGFSVNDVRDLHINNAGKIVEYYYDTDYHSHVFVATIVPSPEILVRGNGNEIVDGSALAWGDDLTDFGATTQNAVPIAHTFEVVNIGTLALTTASLTLPAGFSLVEGLSPTIAAGSSDTFTVRLNTATPGNFYGQISFATNDSQRSPFNFEISGLVIDTGSDPDSPTPPGDGTPPTSPGSTSAPTIIALSGASSVAEFRATGTVVATVMSVDADVGDTATYTLVGSADGRFAISGNQLVVAGGLLLDYEQATSHLIEIQVADSQGHTLSSVFRIAVTDVNPERITGDSRANTFVGGAGGDVFKGQGGNDTLTGGLGRDQLTGGGGRDVFVLDAKGARHADTITDFNVRTDTIWLEHDAFPRLRGADNVKLSAAQFFKGAAAHDGNDRVIYNPATGALIYDSNGIAPGGTSLIATLDKGLALTHADFFIV